MEPVKSKQLISFTSRIQGSEASDGENRRRLLLVYSVRPAHRRRAARGGGALLWVSSAEIVLGCAVSDRLLQCCYYCISWCVFICCVGLFALGRSSLSVVAG